MLRNLYFNGETFIETRPSESAFEFEIDGGTMKVKAPNVSPETTAASVYEMQAKLAVLGAANFFEGRHALSRKNDGSGLHFKETEQGNFIAEAPKDCQISRHDCEKGKKTFNAWIIETTKKLGFKVKEDGKEEEPKQEAPKKEEPKQDAPKKELPPRQEAPKKPEPAKVTKLDDDIGKWGDGELDSYFDGDADFGK